MGRIKAGYEQTEVGVLPEDWEIVNINDHSTLKARIGWQGLTTAEYLTEGDYYLITGTDIHCGHIQWDSCFFVDKTRYDQDKNIQLKENDILITKDGSIGKVGFINHIKQPATLNSGIFVIRPKSKAYLAKFLFYIFNSEYFDSFLNRLVAGSTINHLYQKDFVTFKFPLPKIQEQNKIIIALSDIDRLIEEVTKLIDKKKAIKDGIMQKLFSAQNNWEEVSLESLTKVFTKQTGFDYTANIKPYLTKKKNNDSIPFIQNKDFKGKWINFDTDYYIPLRIASRFPKILLDEKCLLFSISGSIGNVGIFSNTQTAFIGGAIAVLKFKNTNLLDWVMYYLLSENGQKKISYHLKSGSHQNLILDDIRKIKIPIPAPKVQTTIITILNDIDSELEKLKYQLSKYKAIKTGMMQELLTGNIRLIEPTK